MSINRNIIFLFFLITGLLIVSGCTTQAPLSETTDAGPEDKLKDSQLRIITEEFSPFNYAGPDGKPTGQSTDIVQEILARQNQKAEIEIMPWSEGYGLAQSGPYVALYSTGRTQERENLFKWAGPVASFDYTLYAMNTTGPAINSLEAAKKTKSIGVIKDDVRHQFLLENNFNNIKTFESDSECLKSLVSGEITLWFGSSASAAEVAANEGIDPMTISAAYTVRTVDMYIAFSPDTPDYVVKEWQETLNAIKQDGTYNEIREKYKMPVPSSAEVPKSADAVAEQALNTMSAETDSLFRAVLRTYEVMAAAEDAHSGEWEKIRPLLAVLEENEPDARTWYALTDGSYYTVVDGLTSANLMDRKYFPGVVAGDESVGAVVVSHSTGKNTGIVAVPIMINGDVAGVLGASLYLDTLTDKLRDEIPEPFIFYAIDNERTFAIHSDKGKISQEISEDTEESFKLAVEKIYAQKSGTVEYYDGGIKYTAVFKSSELTGWHFVIAWPAG
ncbi:MAG: transporter substrate-binding domain-containing protein [Methanomicrobiaceae archaeon]|nr:transporter substrate-binding domain-containing protein [Methanomicrobiaceae archaeon]